MTRSIIYSSPFVPAEWIAAHGTRPVRLIPRSAMRTPAVGRSFGVCPFARAFAHEVLSLEEEAAVVFATTCDQMRRAADLVEANSELPVFLMNVPATWRTVSVQRLYLDELKRLGRFLVRIGGSAPSDKKLASVMLDYDSARTAVRESRSSLSAREYAEALADMNPNRQLSNCGDDRHSARRVPIAIVGGPLLKDDFYIYDFVEESGGDVVLSATEHGERMLPARFDRRRVKENPLPELADACFGSIPDAFRRPNSELYRWLKTKFANRNVRGVIFHHYVWCDIWHAEVQRLREWTSLPVLDLHAGDDDRNIPGRLEAQVQAFLQVLR